MVRSLILVAAFLSFTLTLAAQQSHKHPGLAPTQQIDGSINPEKIPDLTAYRLFFLVASTPPNPKPAELVRQSAQVDKIALSDEDHQLLISILNEFRVEYTDLIAQYNQAAKAAVAIGKIPDSKAFLVTRDNLVQATRDKLKALTQNGMSQLDMHVQREKRHMKSIGPATN
jgi:hypothetical protein